MMKLTVPTISLPLDEISVSGVDQGHIQVRDAAGRVYVDAPACPEFKFVVTGALGAHVVFHLAADGTIKETASFKVDCQTEIQDAGGKFKKLLELLRDTMFLDWHKGYEKGLRINGKWYQYYVSWIRDHVHCLKGYKYYDADAIGMQSGIELYADSQRADGMIYDKCKKMLHSDLQNWRDVEFAKGDFIKKIPGNPQRRWQRVPVENDVEYLWIEGLYYTWKATGDNDWMSRYLDTALQAVRYSTSDVYRWSEKYKLLKRGYTIDTWDFQHREDIARSGSSMKVDPEQTIFGVMFGDNTGMIASCRYLAEMLGVHGRDADAQSMQDLASDLEQRLNDLAWNGKFFTHHVSEQPDIKRDCGGTDENAQVVQSNAYSLNRGIAHDKCVGIIKAYQAIREEMPATSAGEFYSCYPPFDKGFGHNDWNYMNGGVTTICGGELAHGAFEHGFEAYGVDILQRLLDWTERLDGYLHCCLKGKLSEPVATNWDPIDCTAVANVDFTAARADHDATVPAWTSEGDNDMRGLPTGAHIFEGIPFSVINPAENASKACIGLAQREGYAPSARLAIGKHATSVYFLHTMSGAAAEPLGSCVFHYADGSHVTQYVNVGKQVQSWFMPAPNSAFVGGNGAGKRPAHLRVAWQGANGTFENVGMFVYGWNNPHPEKEIADIEFLCAEHQAFWFIAGVTVSDQTVRFEEGPVSYGIPDMWGSAAVVYALLEGLAGIVDDGVAFDRVRLSPRWDAADIDEVTASAVYPSSKGYCRYQYMRDKNNLTLRVAGNGEQLSCALLLPAGRSVKRLRCNGIAQEPRVHSVEASLYLSVQLRGLTAHLIEIELTETGT